ncbi:MAG: hypothetical protein K2L37_00155, partial [Lactobacillus sp.]|nr:hypothetical protein [Lactobacillus sp.]
MEYENTMDIQNEPKTDTTVERNEEEAPTDIPKKQRGNFKTMECKVISYNEKLKTLDVNFSGYGIRIKDVPNFYGDTVTIRYKGDIG